MSEYANHRLTGVYKTGVPRQRVTRFRFQRLSLFKVLTLLIAIIFAAGWWLMAEGYPQRTFFLLGKESIKLTAKMGFKIKEVMVRGRSQTSRVQLLEALQISEGMPIISINLVRMQQRVIQLPWVSNARIERILPDTLLVSIEEKKPLAIWQFKGKLALIDENGGVILRDDLESYSFLPLVVGDGAASRASELIQLLNVEPDLMHFVKAATWVGGRRWNLHLHQDIDVRLPESDPISAWRRLAEYDRDHGIIGRKIQVLDLRIPGRLIVRMIPENIDNEKNDINKQET